MDQFHRCWNGIDWECFHWSLLNVFLLSRGCSGQSLSGEGHDLLVALSIQGRASWTVEPRPMGVGVNGPCTQGFVQAEIGVASSQEGILKSCLPEGPVFGGQTRGVSWPLVGVQGRWGSGSTEGKGGKTVSSHGADVC